MIEVDTIRYRVVNRETDEQAADFPGHDFGLAVALCNKLAGEEKKTWDVYKSERVYSNPGINYEEAKSK